MPTVVLVFPNMHALVTDPNDAHQSVRAAAAASVITAKAAAVAATHMVAV
jgi:hypothetical protein